MSEFSEFHRVSVDFTWFYWVLMDLRHFREISGFYWVLIGVTEFYLGLLGSTGI